MAIKLCLVSSWFPNNRNPNLAPFVLNFAKDLNNSGVDVYVISVTSSNEPQFQNVDGLKVFRVNPKFPLFSIYRLLSSIKPDIIHVHAPNYFGSMSIIPAKIKKIPILATVHRAEIDSVNFLLNILRKLVLRQFDKIVAVSQFSKSLAINAGGKEDQIIVIYNSCDERLFFPDSKTPSRKRLNLPLDKKIILFAGNLIKIKGIFVLINAIIDLKNRSDFCVVIVGKGEEEDVVKKLIVEASISDKIHLMGWHPQELLPEFFKASDIFVLPSFTEGHSVAILESMASGIPVIATSVGGNLETIDNGVNGFLIPAGDHNYLSNKISNLLDSNKLLDFISKNAINTYSRRFRKQIQIEEHLKLYKTLLQQSK
ncbi:glycosyltransferase family 4 protein [Candidatus Nitrosocosmicus hydrocola]|uniref:glycosyltransferase family 4 protein n=1 Tax=Candidatus Nitrosocosmicus hydrocola TaxID=1826872 RepID=UPI000A4476DF|nr:glycosyltransferase family 4 protein [Candidatus Nitrosocosmicus hydrocola]